VTARQLIRNLERRGVRIEIDPTDHRLTLDGPTSVLTPPLIALAREHRRDLVRSIAPGTLPWRIDAIASCVPPDALLYGSVRLYPSAREIVPLAGICWSCGDALGGRDKGHACVHCRAAFDKLGVQPVVLIAALRDDPPCDEAGAAERCSPDKVVLSDL